MEVLIDKEYYVYEIKFENGLIYVGSTGNLRKRISTHYSGMRTGKHSNVNVQKLFDAGLKFSISLNRMESKESALVFEQLFIDRYTHYNCCLNIGKSVKGGDNLTRNPNLDNIIKTITESLETRYKQMSTEEKVRLFSRPGEMNGMYGKTHSTKVSEASRLRATGNTYALGNKWSDESRAKLSVIASQRTGAKNPFFGKTHTDEYKRKASESRLGLKPINSNKIEIDGILYQSQADAAKALGISSGLITYRLKSKKDKYSGYRVIK